MSTTEEFPSVTPEAIDENIVAEFYGTGLDLERLTIGDDNVPPDVIEALSLLTVCVLVVKNKFTFVGTSSPVSPGKFSAAKGREVARKNAIDLMWPAMGYALKEKLAIQNQRIEENIAGDFDDFDPAAMSDRLDEMDAGDHGD